MNRVLPYDGWLNLRDLGGLVAEGGRRVRPGRIYRSENPVLSPEQLTASLGALGLTRVVDLRSRAEAAHACQPWSDHGVNHERIPLSAGASESWNARYPSYLENRPANVVAAMRAILGSEDGPVLVHCAAGKDRTGVMVALVLSLLGVPDEKIVDDYVLTAPAVEPVLRRLEATGMYGVTATPEFIEDQRPRRETMEAFLGWLDGHGGADAWLVRHGIEPEILAGFRSSTLA